MNAASLARQILSSLAWLLFVVANVRGQDVPAPTPDGDARASREKAFAEKMSGCKMVGYFTVSDPARKDAAAREESYTIAKAEKLRGDKWRFTAKIAYNKREVTLPIVVSVLWAGDTPVIQVTKIPVPTMGVYTARVLVYETHYAGFWSGGDHGGHMYGRIVRADEDERRDVEKNAAKQPETAEPESEESHSKDGVAPDKGKNQGNDDSESASSPSKDSSRKGGSDWPQFRGVAARGIADAYVYPRSWNVETGDNVLFKVPLPGLAHSSPVIWGDRIFVTTAVPKDGTEASLTVGLYGSIAPVEGEGAQDLRVLCLDRKTGEILWARSCFEGVPDVKRHPKGSFAASTPAVDGKHVVAHFGSEGLYCFDFDGQPLWHKSLGHLDAGFYMLDKAQWGYASSPVLHEGKVIVQCDVQGQSFLTALDADDGTETWRKLRDEVPTWGSPTVDLQRGKAQIIVNGYKHIGGYDFATGDELWRVRGGGDIPVPTPIVHKGLVYITNAHGRQAPILAIDARASGEFSMDASESDHVVWSQMRRGNYMQTPIAHSSELYCCNDAGVLQCIDNKTGELVYRERMGGGRMGFTSSGILADGKLYFGSEDGEVHVIRAGREFEELAVNELGETLMSTPAASRGVLYFRARKHLFAIGSRG